MFVFVFPPILKGMEEHENAAEIYDAISRGDLAMVRKFFPEDGSSSPNVVVSNWLATPLFLACCERNVEIAEYLIGVGADVSFNVEIFLFIQNTLILESFQSWMRKKWWQNYFCQKLHFSKASIPFQWTCEKGFFFFFDFSKRLEKRFVFEIYLSHHLTYKSMIQCSLSC